MLDFSVLFAFAVFAVLTMMAYSRESDDWWRVIPLVVVGNLLLYGAAYTVLFKCV